MNKKPKSVGDDFEEDDEEGPLNRDEFMKGLLADKNLAG